MLRDSMILDISYCFKHYKNVKDADCVGCKDFNKQTFCKSKKDCDDCNFADWQNTSYEYSEYDIVGCNAGHIKGGIEGYE